MLKTVLFLLSFLFLLICHFKFKCLSAIRGFGSTRTVEWSLAELLQIQWILKHLSTRESLFWREDRVQRPDFFVDFHTIRACFAIRFLHANVYTMWEPHFDLHTCEWIAGWFAARMAVKLLVNRCWEDSTSISARQMSTPVIMTFSIFRLLPHIWIKSK